MATTATTTTLVRADSSSHRLHRQAPACAHSTPTPPPTPVTTITSSPTATPPITQITSPLAQSPFAPSVLPCAATPPPAPAPAPAQPSVFDRLGPDLCCLILSHVAGEPLHRPITTDAYRFILPFAVTSHSHYALVSRAVVGLSLLPLNFTLDHTGHRRRPPPFPPALLLAPLSASSSPFCSPLSFSPLSAPSHNAPGAPAAGASPASPSPPPPPLRRVGPTPVHGGVVDCSLPPSAPTALDRHLPPAVAHLPSLRVLHLFRNSQVCDDALGAIAAAAPQLTELRLRANRSLTVAGVRALRACARLRILDLSYCLGLSDECGPALAAMPALHTLLLAYWPVSDAFVETLARSASLRDLCLTACASLSGAACGHLARANRLTVLRFRSAPGLDDAAVRRLSGLSQLATLDVALSRQVSDGALEALSDPRRQPRLTKLTFSQCAAITDRGVQALCRNDNVRVLDLSFCHHITDDAVEALVRLPYLESVDLSGCRNLSDAAVERLAQVPWLCRVGLSRCTGLTDRAVAALIEATNKPLELVDVRNCFAMSSDALDELGDACVQLLRSPERS